MLLVLLNRRSLVHLKLTIIWQNFLNIFDWPKAKGAQKSTTLFVSLSVSLSELIKLTLTLRLNHFTWLCHSVFWHPLLRVFDTKRGMRGSIVELRAYITLRVLLVIEWRHELIANDWRSMARNLTVVCFSVMFTIQWLLLHHWHTSPQGGKKWLWKYICWKWF